MKSGLTSLGIVNMNMVTTEELMKENNVILEELMNRTKNLLEQKRPIFDNSLDILLKEEILSGNNFVVNFVKTRFYQHKLLCWLFLLFVVLRYYYTLCSENVFFDKWGTIKYRDKERVE